MKLLPAVSALLVSACAVAPAVQDVPTRLTAGPGCSIEVLSLPPTGPYQTLARSLSANSASGSLELVAAEGCRQGADAIVVPVPPEPLRWMFVGTFVKRLPRATSNEPKGSEQTPGG